MEESIKSVLSSMLLRTLRADPKLTVDAATSHVLELIRKNRLLTDDVGTASGALQSIRQLIRRYGVLNPKWLADEKDMGVYFYFVNAQPGWLGPLVEQAQALVGSSYYILYGAWDLLIVLHGSKEEAGRLQKTISDSPSYELAYFSAGRIPLFYGWSAAEPRGKGQQKVDTSSKIINALVADYDAPKLQNQRALLEKGGIFLGSRWEVEPSPSTDVSAIVGIRLGKGIRALDPNDVLRALQSKDESLKTCLVHLVETDSGYPFNYVAKLVCSGRDELDRATDAIAYCRVGAVPLEGVTCIVARGKQEFPKVGAEINVEIGPSLDLSAVDDAAKKILIDLGSEATKAFNALQGTTKLVVLRSLAEVISQMQNQSWDEETHARIQAAYGAFARATIEGAKQGSLVGPVMLLAVTVEETMQKSLSRIIDVVYDKDLRRAQNELKLPTKIISTLSLGKAVMAFRAMRAHNDFVFISSSLDDIWLKRMERFAEARNTWAHTGSAPGNSTDAAIEDARRVFVDGIELIRWIWTDVLAAHEQHLKDLRPVETGKPHGSPRDTERTRADAEIKLRPSGEREFGVFLSHSAKDAEIAKRIAEALRAMTYEVFYADWAIKPGQSIVGKINEFLARNDTLVVLLSQSSVKSKWVERELNTALMSQLSGQAVTVLPILIEDCDIPATLQDIRYLDMRQNFQEGFIRLLEFLQTRTRK